MDQHEFVETCLVKYRWESPPQGQHFEDAHYPLPRCKGGTSTVVMWSCDHTLQGLLQSEELNYPCIHGADEQKDRYNLEQYYPEYLPLLDKWLLELRRLGGLASISKLQAHPNSVEGRVRGGKAANEAMQKHPNTAAARSETAKKNCEVINSRPDAADMREKNLEVMRSHTNSAEGWSRGGSATAKKLNSQKWRCLVTGFVSSLSGLGRYQRARGIDTTLRERVS